MKQNYKAIRIPNEQDLIDSKQPTSIESDSIIPLHVLLDRLEILYPNISRIADLRRAVVDQDLSSIFRLCDQNNKNKELRKAIIDENLHSIFRLMEEYNVLGHSDDLRRAVLEKNLYSLFRLFPEDDEKVNLYRTAIVNKNLRSICKLLGNDDLRKLIVEENIWKLWPILDKYVTTQFTNSFKNFFVNEITINMDCFSRGQLQSKLWVLETLRNLKYSYDPKQGIKKKEIDLGTVFLCAGWYGTLATMLFESNIKLDKIRSFDIDPSCLTIAKIFNKPWVMNNWKFQACTEDIHNINFDEHTYTVTRNDETKQKLTDSPDTIINTSCEHIQSFDKWYNKITQGKLLILQTNNYFDLPEHVNCSKTLKSFSNDTPMSKVLYEGKLDLEKYTRFMKIGYK
tara:strand:+ start:170 stop:1363 length:1194 start_codon:yes stop_codon:yes gene_type:complete